MGYSLSVALDEHVRQTQNQVLIDGSLLDAVWFGESHEVDQLVSQKADIHGTRGVDQFGALHLAAIQNQLQITEALLSLSADPNVVDSCNRTPLFWAAMQGHLEMTTRLLPITRDRHRPDRTDQTALQRCAAIGASAEMVQLLESWAVPQVVEEVPAPVVPAPGLDGGLPAALDDSNSNQPIQPLSQRRNELADAYKEFKRAGSPEDSIAARRRVLAARNFAQQEVSRRQAPPKEKPTEKPKEKPAKEKPAEEKPAEEKPAEEKPAKEKPAKEKLVEAYEEFKRAESPEDSIAARRRVLEAQQEISAPAAVKEELVEAYVEFKRAESPEDSIAARRRVLEARQEVSVPAAVREELVEAYEEFKRAESPEDSIAARRRVFAAKKVVKTPYQYW